MELDRNDSNTRSKLTIRRACISNFGLNRFDSSFERIRFAFAFAPRKQDLSRRRIFKNFPPRLYRVLVRFFSLSKLNHSFFFFLFSFVTTMTIIQVLQVVINVEKIYILSSYVLMRLRIFYKYLSYFHNPADKQDTLSLSS